MDTPKNELRQRLRELLSVPERERSDEQWDEIIELEIRLAPGNQIDSSRNGEQQQPGQNFRPRPPKSRQNQGGKQGRRPNKGYPPRSGGGGAGGGGAGGGGVGGGGVGGGGVGGGGVGGGGVGSGGVGSGGNNNTPPSSPQ